MLDGAFWDGARFGMPRRGGEEVVCTYPPTRGPRRARGRCTVSSVLRQYVRTFSLLGEKGERGVFSRPLKAPPCPLLASLFQSVSTHHRGLPPSGPPSPPARTPPRIPSPHAVGDASRGARRERREGGDAMEPEGGCDSGEARGGARPSSCLSMVA